MNILPGEITEIITEDEISLVKVKVDHQVFSSLVLDTPATSPYLKTGNPVRLLFKETEVIIARAGSLAISVQNKIECVVTAIRQGNILCELTLNFPPLHQIRSIITRNACEQLKLQVNDIIIALIKTNEVSLSAND